MGQGEQVGGGRPPERFLVREEAGTGPGAESEPGPRVAGEEAAQLTADVAARSEDANGGEGGALRGRLGSNRRTLIEGHVHCAPSPLHRK